MQWRNHDQARHHRRHIGRLRFLRRIARRAAEPSTRLERAALQRDAIRWLHGVRRFHQGPRGHVGVDEERRGIRGAARNADHAQRRAHRQRRALELQPAGWGSVPEQPERRKLVNVALRWRSSVRHPHRALEHAGEAIRPGRRGRDSLRGWRCRLPEDHRDELRVQRGGRGGVPNDDIRSPSKTVLACW